MSKAKDIMSVMKVMESKLGKDYLKYMATSKHMVIRAVAIAVCFFLLIFIFIIIISFFISKKVINPP